MARACGFRGIMALSGAPNRPSERYKKFHFFKIFRIHRFLLNYCGCLLRAIVWRNTDTSNGKNMVQYAPTYARFFPAGHSLKAIIHFSQIALGDDIFYFKKFDYGKTENLRIYGSNKP